MNISLTKSLEEFVKEKVDNGIYNSPDEVIMAGLRILQSQTINLQERKRIALRQVKNGEYHDADDEEFWDQLISKVKKERK